MRSDRTLAIQMVTQCIPPLDRTKHVWIPLKGRQADLFKCVLCGAISGAPSNETESRTYEPLTAEERALCPMKE